LGEDQKSPVFIQWLDCVHQLLYQFPHAFEFNVSFLTFIASHLYTCKYGTFLFNCEKERFDYDAKNRTISIWTDAWNEENRTKFVNPFYVRENINEIIPNYGVYKLRLWEEYFYGYDLNEFATKVKLNNALEESSITNNLKYFEYIKSEDLKIIQKQNESIEDLKEVVKEIAIMIEKSESSQSISEKSQEIINSLNNMPKKQNEIAQSYEASIECSMHIVDNYIRNNK
jgi:hypothetical protein